MASTISASGPLLKSTVWKAWFPIWGIRNLNGFTCLKSQELGLILIVDLVRRTFPYLVFMLPCDFELICISLFSADRPARPVLDATRREAAEILGSLPVQDRDWLLLCTTLKLREHKLTPENASLQREPVYKEPSEKQKERIDKHLSKQTSQPTSEMTFLKQAPVLNRKAKTGTATTSPIVPQKRKSDVVATPAADSSKKLAKPTQDKGKKVVIDPAVRARDFLVLQEKFVGEEFMSKVERTPSEELMPRSAELASQFMTIFSKAFVAGSKEVELLKRKNAQLQESVKKLKQEAANKDKEHKEFRKQVELEAKNSKTKIEEMSRDLEVEKENGKQQYDQAVSDYICTTLSKIPNFDFSILGAEAAEMAEAFRAMSPTQTQGGERNLFPEDDDVADTEEVVDEAASKVADESTTPTAPIAPNA
ncbi:uncharacterized protein LOC133029961 [Cannabis sativa]|uniref:uncharacterized protein LOC133029961 n=1 Tax=Cannabis sativa TaxID=3483 RepID=UPI0029CA1508|nr:uncharacterized protein LOC133029961 [Cannabis sativa]